MIELREFEAVCADPELARAAARQSVRLMERFDLRFSLDCWDQPAIAAYSGAAVVGFLQFKKDEKLSRIDVGLAWCSPDHPQALARMAIALRARAKAGGVAEITFTYHEGNAEMARLADAVGAALVSHYCILSIAPAAVAPETS